MVLRRQADGRAVVTAGDALARYVFLLEPRPLKNCLDRTGNEERVWTGLYHGSEGPL